MDFGSSAICETPSSGRKLIRNRRRPCWSTVRQILVSNVSGRTILGVEPVKRVRDAVKSFFSSQPPRRSDRFLNLGSSPIPGLRWPRPAYPTFMPSYLPFSLPKVIRTKFHQTLESSRRRAACCDEENRARTTDTVTNHSGSACSKNPLEDDRHDRRIYEEC